jgi:hypothetical protein
MLFSIKIENSQNTDMIIYCFFNLDWMPMVAGIKFS